MESAPKHGQGIATSARAEGLGGDGKKRGWGTGVFDRTLNRRAFFDKLVLSIRGNRRQFPEMVRNRINKPIWVVLTPAGGQDAPL